MKGPIKRLSCLMLILSMIGFVGYSNSYAAKRKPPVKPKASQKVSVVPKPAKKQENEQAFYDYDPRGRRDPFTSLIDIAKEKQRQKKSSNPLENFDVNEIKLTAIVWDKNGHYALITLPNKKSYTIRKGMTLGLYGGHVEKITRDSVVVRQQIPDYRGRIETSDTILKLRKEGEQ